MLTAGLLLLASAFLLDLPTQEQAKEAQPGKLGTQLAVHEWTQLLLYTCMHAKGRPPCRAMPLAVNVGVVRGSAAFRVRPGSRWC
jgi:hypothetical protein